MGWTTTSWPCLTQLKTYVELCPATLTVHFHLDVGHVRMASALGRRLRQRTASLDLKRGNIWQLGGGSGDARPIFDGNVARLRRPLGRLVPPGCQCPRRVPDLRRKAPAPRRYKRQREL